MEIATASINFNDLRSLALNRTEKESFWSKGWSVLKIWAAMLLFCISLLLIINRLGRCSAILSSNLLSVRPIYCSLQVLQVKQYTTFEMVITERGSLDWVEISWREVKMVISLTLLQFTAMVRTS